ncbi:MAG TPA: TetR family transcriptional regulator C-terminal domain-containing protein [Longimicrobiales bacterium]|nr:TetR family transcriptional regulator C-terminal domain-containing protein [Longimicrobiales bacterium]
MRREAEVGRRNQITAAALLVASRDGLSGLTVRAVAVEARVSHALVLFHFGRKERLVRALLDWLIESMAVLHISEDVARFPLARDRLHALMQQEMARLSHEPEHTRLFLEYWALGTRDAAIRTRISAELERYRTAFREIMEELIDAEPLTFAGATADGMAAVAVSWIHGCAVQAMIDPVHFDTDEYLVAVRKLVARLG